jgi:hypothetical protein
LSSTQQKASILQGRVDQLTGVVAETERTAKREHSDAMKGRIATLEQEINESLKQGPWPSWLMPTYWPRSSRLALARKRWAARLRGFFDPCDE